MKIDYIITTATGDPNAWPQHTPSRVQPMQKRIELLRDRILPAAIGFDDIIVVGRCHGSIKDAHPDITYIHLPPLVRDRVEAFRQREVASRWSTADCFVLGADDHALCDDFVVKLREMMDEPWDILTPKRIHGITGEELNNGKEDGYSPWHLHVVRRHVWAQLPWTTVSTLWCDVAYPRIYADMNFKMEWSDELWSIDVEAEEHET